MPGIPKSSATSTNIGVLSIKTICEAGCLSDVERKPKDVAIGFTHVYEAGGDEHVDELVELEFANAMRVYLARVIADDIDL